MSRTVARLACALVLSVVAQASLAADRALLIGIDDYSGSRVDAPDGRQATIRDLRGALNDVQAMRRLLEQGFDVAPEAILELTDAQATREAVLQAIDRWLIEGTEPGDRVFLHFSGHGSQVRDRDGDERDDGLDEVLVTSDARCRTDPSARRIVSCENVLTDDVLGERLDRLVGRHTLVLIDSCHAGTSTRSLFDAGTQGTRLASFDFTGDSASRSFKGELAAPGTTRVSMAGLVDQAPDRVALFAVAPGQLAAEIADENQMPVGLFTDRLVDGILERDADANRDGEVSFAELLTHVKGESSDYCKTYPGHAACSAGGVNPQAQIDPALFASDVLGFGARAALPGQPDGRENDAAPDKGRPLAEQAAVGGAAGDDSVQADALSAALPLRNAANLRVGLSPTTRFTLNQPMTIEIAAERTGLLIVMDRNADGELVPLYPRPGVTREPPRPDGRPLGWVRAGRSVLMPDAYSGEQWLMQEPLGSGSIIAVLAEDFADVRSVVDGLVSASADFAPLSGPQAWLGALYAALERVVPDASGQGAPRSARWSIATIDYTVVP